MTRIGCRAHDYGKLPAAPAAPLIRDEVILTADTADLHYLKAMAAGL